MPNALLRRPRKSTVMISRDGRAVVPDFLAMTDLTFAGTQPVSGESVCFWANVTGNANAVRGFQSYTAYTGSFGATSYDALVSQSGNTAFDHLVCYQGVAKIVSGSGNAAFLAGTYISNIHNGSGTLTTSYGYYWGGTSGTGTVTNKWAFFCSVNEPSYFGGDIYCNTKMSIGTGVAGQTFTMNSAGNCIFEMQQAGSTIGYLANGSAVFGGAATLDMAFNCATSGKKVILGNAGVRGLEVVDGTANFPGTTDATAIGTAGVTAQGGLSVAKSIWCAGSAGQFVNIANSTGALKINSTQVVGAQITGYGTPTGGSRLSSFPGATATLAQCSAQIAQIILDLKTHGLFGV